MALGKGNNFLLHGEGTEGHGGGFIQINLSVFRYEQELQYRQ